MNTCTCTPYNPLNKSYRQRKQTEEAIHKIKSELCFSNKSSKKKPKKNIFTKKETNTNYDSYGKITKNSLEALYGVHSHFDPSMNSNSDSSSPRIKTTASKNTKIDTKWEYVNYRILDVLTYASGYWICTDGKRYTTQKPAYMHQLCLFIGEPYWVTLSKKPSPEPRPVPPEPPIPPVPPEPPKPSPTHGFNLDGMIDRFFMRQVSFLFYKIID